MADSEVQLQPDSTGKKIDNTTETTGAGAVFRQRISLAAAGSNNQLAIDGSGNIGVNNFPASQPVSGTLTVIQGTGTNLHVVVDTAPSTAVTNAGLTNLDVALSTRTKPADQQHVIVDTMTPALALDATVNALLKPASTLAAVTTVGAVTSITNPLPAGTNVLGHV